MILNFAEANRHYKTLTMKKIILFTVLIISGLVVLSSCGATKRGTGCPMTDNIIH